MTMRIRNAGELDIPAIARVYVAAWRETYRGIVPDAILDSHELARRALAWSDSVRSADRDVFVADVDGETVGFAVVGPVRDALLGVEGEIEAIYVRKRFQCRGIGSRLMGAAAVALRERGRKSAGLWVARQDVAALAFFRTLGGSVGMARIAEMPGRSFIEMAMVWDAASDLTVWDDRGHAPLLRTLATDGARSPAAVDRTGVQDAFPAA